MARTSPPPEPQYAGAAHADSAGRVPASAFRPTIATERLLLRPLCPADADAIVATIGDLAVSRNLARVPHPYSRKNAEDYVSFANRNAIAKRSLISAVTLRSELIGVVSIDRTPTYNRLGYWLARNHWGRGYATEAVGGLVAYAFTVLGVRLARAGVYVDNAASLHVLIKLGFRTVGRRASRSLARDAATEHIATVLTRARFMQTFRR